MEHDKWANERETKKKVQHDCDINLLNCQMRLFGLTSVGTVPVSGLFERLISAIDVTVWKTVRQP